MFVCLEKNLPVEIIASIFQCKYMCLPKSFRHECILWCFFHSAVFCTVWGLLRQKCLISASTPWLRNVSMFSSVFCTSAWRIWESAIKMCVWIVSPVMQFTSFFYLFFLMCYHHVSLICYVTTIFHFLLHHVAQDVSWIKTVMLTVVMNTSNSSSEYETEDIRILFSPRNKYKECVPSTSGRK